MKGKAQTRATARYQNKVGLIAKSFKVRRELAEEFKEACDKIGEGQAATISRLMQEFIDSTK